MATKQNKAFLASLTFIGMLGLVLSSSTTTRSGPPAGQGPNSTTPRGGHGSSSPRPSRSTTRSTPHWPGSSTTQAPMTTTEYYNTPPPIGSVHDSCDGVTYLTDELGTIRSPNYAGHYDPDSFCQTVIEASEGHTVEVYIVDFKLERSPERDDCKYDYLKFIDGPDPDSPAIKTLCNYEISYQYFTNTSDSTIRSSGRQLRLEFKSDSATQERGYQLYYRTVPSVCGEVPEGDSGWMSPPRRMYSDTYLPGIRCKWRFQVEEGLKARMDFYSFSMEKCPYDFLELSNGVEREAGARKLCGDLDMPESFISTGHQVVAYLETDRSVQREGFRARYYAVLDNASINCGGPVHETGGVISYPGAGTPEPNRHCVWTVTTEPGKHIKFSLSQLTLADQGQACSSFLEIRDGGYLDSPKLFKLCESYYDVQQMTASSHQLFIRFKTGPDAVLEQSFSLNFQTEPGCGAVLKAAEGVVQSPNYPHNITDNNNCTWSFDLAPHLNYVDVELTDMDIGTHGRSYFDHYTGRYGCDEGAHLAMGHVYNYGSGSSTQYCGQELASRELQVESYREPLIRFVSTQGTPGRGFQLKYKAGCHPISLYGNGNLSSPNFPGAYDYSVDCVWIIYGSGSYGVARVNVSYLNLNCESQSVQISDQYGQPRLSLCGEGVESQEYELLLPAMMLRYTTGPTQDGQGFAMDWEFESCNQRLEGQSGDLKSPSYLVNVPPGYMCFWEFANTDGQDELTVHFDSFSWTSCEDSPLQVVHYDYSQGYGEQYHTICSDQTTVKVTGYAYIKLLQNAVGPRNISFSGNYSISCGGTFIVSDMTSFSSPGFYGGNFTADQTCTWTLLPSDPDKVVLVDVNMLSIGDNPKNCSQGSLTIITPSEEYELCGSRVPVEMTYGVHGSRIEVIFSVKEGAVGRGFYGYISQTTPGCRGVLTEETGSLNSPNYPDNFPRHANCAWMISAPFGSRIELTFHDIGMRDPGSYYCGNSGLYVSGVTGYVDLCKSSLNSPLIVKSMFHTLTLTLNDYSYSDITQRGFNATYRIVDGCGQELNEPSGHFGLTTPLPINDTCSWKIKVASGKAIRFKVNTYKDYNYVDSGFDCDYTMNLKVSEYPLQRYYDGSVNGYCQRGTNFPDVFLWNTDTLYVAFHNIGSKSAFDAFYEEVDASYLCGGEVSSPGGMLMSPKRAAQDCSGHSHLEWVIRADSPGQLVKLHFHTMYWSRSEYMPGYRRKREAGDHCTSAGAMVLDGENVLYEACSYYSSLSGRTFTSSGSTLTLRFTNGATFPYYQVQYTSMCFNKSHMAGPIDSGAYTAGTDCGWLTHLVNANGSKVSLAFDEVHLAPGQGPCGRGRDRIELYNYWDETYGYSGQLATICNETSLQDTYLATNNQIYIRLVAGTSSPGGRGFKARTMRVCHTDVYSYSSQRTLSSPPDMDDGPCSWNITTSYGRVVRLSFPTFNLGSDCERNFLKIYDGVTETTYCANNAPSEPWHSGDRWVLLTYFSEGGPQADQHGFQVSYRGVYYTAPPPGCGGNLTTDNGLVLSPNHPRDYTNNLDCTWRIRAPPDHVIQLSFNAFNVEESAGTRCVFDNVQVFDGTSRTQSLALSSKLCSNNLPQPTYTSSANNMTVHFHTDGSVVRDGFNASYAFYQRGSVPTQGTTTSANSGTTTSANNGQCYETLMGPSGTFESPNYPSDYPNGIRCQWTVEVETGMRVFLNITDFALEGAGCTYDYVKVYDGGSDSAEELSGKLCGETMPAQRFFHSTGHQVSLLFVTDGSVTKRGFSVDYTQLDADDAPMPETLPVGTGCGGHLDGDSGNLTSPNHPGRYNNNAECYWYITTSAGTTVQLSFTVFELESANNCGYDVVKVYNGHLANTNSKLSDDLCGTDLDLPLYFTASSNTMMVYFKTDGSVTRSGFSATYQILD